MIGSLKLVPIFVKNNRASRKGENKEAKLQSDLLPQFQYLLYSNSSRVWEITVLTSSKRRVITQSNGKGWLDEREDVIIHSKEWIMDDTNMASPGIASRVSGRIGFPPSSFRAEIFAAHRMVAMLRKSESFAINRPTQIL